MNSTTAVEQFDHFIALNTQQLTVALRQSGLTAAHMDIIHKLHQILSFEYYQKLRVLKKLYLPFDPDQELVAKLAQTPEPKHCIDAIRQLLEKANYSELKQQQIEFALQKSSPYGLEIHIDFSAFAEVSLFYQGKSRQQLLVRDWKKLWIGKKTIELIRYRRLFLLLRYRDTQAHPGIQLKLFKDILRPDLEMLFPECTICLKLFDKIKLAITGGGGTAGGLFATIGKISAAISPWTIAVAIGGFALLLWRQVSKIFIQKTRYMATLARNLYFHNLDNNAGALNFLIDLARQQEIREITLAYAMINLKPLGDSQQLDNACEQWLMKNFNRQTDFDINDAIDKLQRYGLLDEQSTNLTCKDPRVIAKALDQRWQKFIERDVSD
jgi:hypothetical protein